MTTTTSAGLDLLGVRMAAAIGGRRPGHIERLGWNTPQRAWRPVMTKGQMMEHFDEVVTDRRLTRDLADRHIAASAAEPALLFGCIKAAQAGSACRRWLAGPHRETRQGANPSDLPGM